MKLGLLSRKGGVGKTTLAVHFAGALAREGNVLLIDEDDTRNALGWTRRGDMPFQAVSLSGLVGAQGPFAHMVVDSRGGLNPDDMADLYESADRLVVPVSSEFMALDTLVQTAGILRQVDPDLGKLRVVMMMVKKGRKLDEAREALAGLGLSAVGPSVRFSEAFKDASSAGCLVRDVTGNKLAKSCWDDVLRVLKAVRA